MDLQSVKNMLSIKTTTHDDYLIEMIPIVIEYAQDHCNQTFISENLPSGVKLFVAKAIEFNMGDSTLKGRTMGEVSYSYNTDFPSSLKRYLAPYRRVRFS
jgi:hypothetical protein